MYIEAKMLYVLCKFFGFVVRTIFILHCHGKVIGKYCSIIFKTFSNYFIQYVNNGIYSIINICISINMLKKLKTFRKKF